MLFRKKRILNAYSAVKRLIGFIIINAARAAIMITVYEAYQIIKVVI